MSLKEFMLKDHLNKARERAFALGQFNFSTLEQLQGIMLASKELSAPLICGTSSGEVDFLGVAEAASLVSIMREKMNVPVFLNLDHGRDLETIKKAIECGYDAVHFDGSHLPMEENIEITKKVVLEAHKKGVLVEGEVGKMKGESTLHDTPAEKPTLTSMEKIVKFTKETEVDSIALDVGSVHGIYADAPVIDFDRIEKAKNETGCFIVLHGGSGVEEKDMREGIKRGVVKVNVNTELRAVWRDALYREMTENKKEIVPYKILPAAREATREKVKKMIKLFSYEKGNI